MNQFLRITVATLLLHPAGAVDTGQRDLLLRRQVASDGKLEEDADDASELQFQCSDMQPACDSKPSLRCKAGNQICCNRMAVWNGSYAATRCEWSVESSSCMMMTGEGGDCKSYGFPRPMYLKAKSEAGSFSPYHQ
mmetsp:Transcript_53147/g.95388  ORF Transcript_53147/g.95388 Transcript_53147/m.95388 type:complete len:136 (+) Transcript_53147:94-501(+)